MQNKIQETIRLLNIGLRESRKPVIAWSGGKDSTVLLFIARQIMPDIDILHFKTPFMPERYKHHHNVIENSNGNVYSWPPTSVGIRVAQAGIEMVETYGVNDGWIKVFKHIQPPVNGKKFACAKDWLSIPKVVAYSDFDCVFVGHKSSDVDPLGGQVPLMATSRRIGKNVKVWYPLHHWDDSDISNFIKSENIQYDTNRYDSSIKNLDDVSGNSDITRTCMLCVDQSQPIAVMCPKHKIMVENISSTVNYEYIKEPFCNLE